jgi:ribosomal 50S subunit-recycling heat shock protein
VTKNKATEPDQAPPIRIDKLLWYLRFVRSRALAQTLVESGHIRLDGRRISRSSTMVHAGQHLVIPLESGIWVIRLTHVPTRRGPAPEAQSCYERSDSPAAPTSPENHADRNPLGLALGL